MKFQVPQFIEVEDKIFGPLTFKQFLYLLGGGAGAFLLFSLLPSFIGLPLAILWAGFGIALAFYKINNRPFIVFLESAFRYLMENKLYIWNKERKEVAPRQKQQEVESSPLSVDRLSQNKLKDIGWSLQVGGDDKPESGTDNTPRGDDTTEKPVA